MSLPTVQLEHDDIELEFSRGRLVSLKLRDSANVKLAAAGYNKTMPVTLHVEQIGPMIRVQVTEQKAN